MSMFTSKTRELLRAANSYTNTKLIGYENVHLRGADGMFGYYKADSDKERDDNDKWPEDGLQLIKPGKLLKKLSEVEDMECTDKEIEDAVNRIKNVISIYGDEHGEFAKTPILSVVRGSLIGAYYLEDNYLESSGNLGGSCMRYSSCLPAFRIYEDNQEVVSMLVLKSEDNKVMARALVWNYGGEYYMDTVYSTKDNFRDMLIDYAKRHGYYYKSQQSCHHNVFDRKGDASCLPFVISIPINFSESWQVPYMDTLFFVVKRGEQHFATNCLAHDDNHSIYRLRSTDTSPKNNWVPQGDYLLHMEVAFSLLYNVKVSDKAHEWIVQKGDKSIDDDDLSCVIKEDYVSHTSYRKFFLDEDMREDDDEYDEDDVYCEYIREYRNIDDCIYIERGQRRNEWVLSEDAVEVRGQWWYCQDDDLVVAADGEYYHLDDVSMCEYTDEYYPHDELTYVEDYGYVNDGDVDFVAVYIDGTWYHQKDCVKSEISGVWMLTDDAHELPDGRMVTEEEYDKWMEENKEEEEEEAP